MKNTKKKDWINKAYPWVAIIGLALITNAPDFENSILRNGTLLAGLWGCGLLAIAKNLQSGHVIAPFLWLMCLVGMTLVATIMVMIATLPHENGYETLLPLLYLIGVGTIGILILEE